MFSQEAKSANFYAGFLPCLLCGLGDFQVLRGQNFRGRGVLHEDSRSSAQLFRQLCCPFQGYFQVLFGETSCGRPRSPKVIGNLTSRGSACRIVAAAGGFFDPPGLLGHRALHWVFFSLGVQAPFAVVRERLTVSRSIATISGRQEVLHVDIKSSRIRTSRPDA